MKTRKNPEQLRQLLELRRCNAATAVPSKKHYKRNKIKKELSKIISEQ